MTILQPQHYLAAESAPEPAHPTAHRGGGLNRAVAFVLAACAPLLLVLASAKAVNYGPLTTVDLGFPLKVAIIAQADLLFVCGWGAFALVALVATLRHPRLHRATRATFLAGCVVIAGYGIVSYRCTTRCACR